MGSHAKSDTYTHNYPTYTPSPIYLTPVPWFSVVAPVYSLSQPHHEMASHPSPGDNRQSTEWWSKRTQGQAKMTAWNSFSYICTRVLHSFICRAASTVIPLLPRPPSHHPSSLTLVYLVTDLCLLPQSTPFWPLIQSFHKPKPFQNSMIHFTR